MANALATQLHPEQETANQAVSQDMMRDDEELSRAIERIDERNELIMDLIRVSRKPGSGLLDPKVWLLSARLIKELIHRDQPGKE